MSRYAVYDLKMGRYLRRVTMPTGTPEAIHTTWTSDRAEAWGFSSVKTARTMVERLGGGERYIIHNERGELRC